MKTVCRHLLLRSWVIAATVAPPPVALGALLLTIGCAEAPVSEATATAAAPAAAAKASATPYEVIDPTRFANPTRVDNPWMPLTPGMRYTFEGTTVEDDGTVLPHRVVIHVTDLTKVIGGIRSVVTWDLDYADGELAEAELAFYAQDDEGNVWRMGEYPEEYDDGKFLTAPTWIHGREDARAGIMMLAKPVTGSKDYAQGWGPKVDWTDRGRVDQSGVEVKVKAGRYPDAIVISETSVSEPNAEQLKYYARGVGNVKVGWRGKGEKSKEMLDLIAVDKLDAKALAEVRKAAFKLEAHAYQVSANVYAHTTPMEPPTGGATSGTPTREQGR